MAFDLDTFEPVDYAVIGAVGAAALVALAACIYTLPWRLRRGCSGSGGKFGGGGGSSKLAPVPAPTADFNVLWRGRAVLSLLSALWALSQLLRVSSIWGANSFLLPPRVTAWTGAGWMCRIYLTLSLGVLHPLCAFTALLMLTAALSRRHRPEAQGHPNARLLGLAALCTLPVAAVQAAIAWVGLAVQYQGRGFEESPRSVLGYFFATYWQGTPEQCSSSEPAAAGGATAADPATDGAAAAAGGCALCAFPAAAVVAHALFSAALLCALWVTSSRLAAAVMNRRLKRRVRLFQAAYSLLVVAGVVALGVSVVRGPFSWLNQACWAGFVASVALTVLLVEWEVVVWPVHDLRAVDKRLAMWADATTAAAFAAAAADTPETRSSTGGGGSGSGGFIKAHNRSAEAEAYVAAAATARTLSMGQPQPRLPPPQPQPQLFSLPLAKR